MRIVIGSDHCGYELKQAMLPMLCKDHEIFDCGCFSTEPVDFPDIAQQLCARIRDGEADRGIMFCGTGVGAAIACNKVKGIRAALCHDVYSAHQCVEHDNVQVLALGNQIVGVCLAEEVIRAFLAAEFSTEEEFRTRVAKLEVMERAF